MAVTPDIKVRVVTQIIPHPFVKPWRHPVWWWKMRHLRRDLREESEAVVGELGQRLRELEDDAFINGTGR
jgi:hypothetical protein